MKTKHVARARKLLFGSGLMVSTLGAGVVVVAVAVPTAAYADPTCYTGCPPSQTAGGDGPAAVPVEPATSVTSDASGGLPFTCADIEQLAAIGGGAVLAGGLLAHRRRRRSRTPA